jgi:integrase
VLLTGQRVQEIIGARWAEVDTARGVLDIPIDRLKSGKKTRRGHVVPLGGLALAALAALPRSGALVFPLNGDPKAGEPMPYASLTQAVARLCKRTAGLAPFSPRDIRRTVKTKLSEIGVAKDIRDRVQGHALHDVASLHYDRFDFLDERRAALVGWEWELRRILGNVEPSPEWRKWLRRFVREPDDAEPGEKLRELLEGPAGGKPPRKRAAKRSPAHA